jgi:hypothetical protein
MALAVSALGSTTPSCAGSDPSQTFTLVGPTRADFERVGETLDYHCGNLSCHGSMLRNLRLYGDQGLRFAPEDIPCGIPTTPAEFDADYRSLVALEPELTSDVVANDGARPERLTLVRKARGVEQHTGGVVFHDSTDVDACTASCGTDRLCTAACYGDRCLVSWLTGDVDVPACGNALPETRCNPL